eukprot:XP_019929923.1 PREDICTED: uncharacterized protein LOC105345909 isoform X2 [Crassostrea gigas]
MQVQTITRGLFAGTVLFGVWCTLTVPAQSLQSDLVSGSLITAGSIGIAALAASAALASMSGLKNHRNCNCRDQPQEPEVSCDVILAAEREKWEQEKQDLEDEVREVCRATNRENCLVSYGQAEVDACTACTDKFDDEIGCDANADCFFANGVCTYNA